MLKKECVYYVLFFIFLLFSPSIGFADISFTNGFWSSTFDCDEVAAITAQNVTYGVCGSDIDAQEHYRGNTAEYSSITTASNYPSGGGGNGYRHNMAVDARNDHSAQMQLNLPDGVDEMWIRFYSRYQSGMTWSYIYEHKVLYFWGSSQWFYLNYPSQGGTAEMDSIGVQANGVGYLTATYDTGWYTTTGGTGRSDGNWDSYEVYVKLNSRAGASDGTVRIWINGTLVSENTSVDMKSGAGAANAIDHIDVGDNHQIATHTSLSSVYEDFDDIAIALPSYSGFVYDEQGNRMIGPLNPAELGRPASPTGLRLVTLSEPVTY